METKVKNENLNLEFEVKELLNEATKIDLDELGEMEEMIAPACGCGCGGVC